jgi:hypothetical protein
MAENRTFKFYGLGYGTEPVTISAVINGVEVYSGPIPTVDLPLPPAVDTQQQVLFTIVSAELNTAFEGSLPMSVVVTSGTAALLGEILSNYNSGTDAASGTIDSFAQCYTGTPTNSENTVDPRSSVYIDGVQQVPPLDKSLGCWTWTVPTGSTLVCDLNVELGLVSQTYIVPQSSTSGTGSGAEFSVLNFVATLLVSGTGYAVNDTITIDGAVVGGTTPENNMTITITEVDANGGILNAR